MAKLYELTGELLKLMDSLYDDDIDEQELILRCESLEVEFEEKAEGYAMIIRSLESDIDGLDNEIKRIAGRKSALTNKVSLLKNNLENAMKITGNTKFKTALFSFGIQKNPPSVKISDDALFGQWIIDNKREDFLTYKKPEINKTAIKEAIMKDGEIIPYVDVVQGERLNIK